jgi:regulator of protease activity HflC (stomatin/prohibitin superfamily)
VILALALIIVWFILAAQFSSPLMTGVGVFASLCWWISLFGFIVNGPNQSRVVQLFGKYIGTLRETGFFYGNPFYWRTRVSLRVRTFETGVSKTEETKDQMGRVVAPATSHREPIKVNDKDGTPIEIGAVVVWKVISPSEAVFHVDNYEEFVRIQADAALRNLTSRYSYDAPEADSHSLRGHIEEVAGQLKHDLQERMRQAGVEVLEARISYLAYAREIAAAMLQRQQAGAIIAARAQIVAGAVGMVEHALEMLAERHVVELDPERRAAMVSNLLVVLCGHTVPQPVLNTGTLYN